MIAVQEIGAASSDRVSILTVGTEGLNTSAGAAMLSQPAPLAIVRRKAQHQPHLLPPLPQFASHRVRRAKPPTILCSMIQKAVKQLAERTTMYLGAMPCKEARAHFRCTCRLVLRCFILTCCRTCLWFCKFVNPTWSFKNATTSSQQYAVTLPS